MGLWKKRKKTGTEREKEAEYPPAKHRRDAPRRECKGKMSEHKVREVGKKTGLIGYQLRLKTR